MAKDKEFVLTPEAEKIYRMFGGIDNTPTVIAAPARAEFDTDGYIDSISQEEEIVEAVRVLLIDAAHYLASFFRGVQPSGSEELWKESIKMIVAVLGRLAEIPERSTELVLRYRGNGALGEEAGYDQLDYAMIMGNYSIDLGIVKGLCMQQGIGAFHLPGRLRSAYKCFGTLNISSISMTLGAWGTDDIKRVVDALQGLATYYKAVSDPKGAAGSVVYDENRQPDPNLTVLSLINRVKIDSLQQVVGQVEELMYCEKPNPSLQQCVSVYDAIFKFKKFREQLQKPAVEVNNVRWLMVSRGHDVISRDKAEVCQALAKVFDKSSRRTAQIIESVYGADYRDISAENLAANLHKLTEFLFRLEKEKVFAPTKSKVVRTVTGCLDQVGDDVFDKLPLPERGLLHDDLFGMASFFKRRVSTNRKLRGILSEHIEFTPQDMQILARDLGIGSEDARQLVAILQECFTEDSHFNRRNFENNIEVFLKSEKKVFAFLWHYFKEIRGRNDRIAFLNSMQLLISRMQRPQDSLEILLRDVVSDPDVVRFSDRNALILVNLLIRNYNKELHKHIELTPEEVLLVRDGLNVKMVAGAGEFIDQEADRFFRKTKSLHKSILDALADREVGGQVMPLHYVVSVERELFVLLSLISGRMPHKIIQSAVKVYGNPESNVYALVADQGQMKTLLGLLQLAIRGLSRFKSDTDLKLLQDVRRRKGEFQARFGDLLPVAVLDKVMAFADAALARILDHT